MKTKNNGTSKASKHEAAIMKIMTVKILDTATASNSSAFSFLREAGFADVVIDGQDVRADASKCGIILVLERKPEAGNYRSPFRIIRVHDDETAAEIDNGTTLFSFPSVNGMIELSARGEEVPDWEITVGPSVLKSIPRIIPFVARPFAPIPTNGEDGEEDEDVYIPLPPATDSIIGNLLKRAVVPDKNNGTPDHLLPQSLASMKQEAKIPDRWPFNPRLRKYMAEFRGNEQSVAAISDALNELSKDESVGDLVLRFDDYHTTITRLLSVQKLVPSLKPLLDRPCKDPERITPNMLKWLVHFPMAEQVKAWEKAKAWGEQNKNKMSSLMLAKLEELAKPYHVCWKPRNCSTGLFVE
jgi:hypothetical protein